MVTGNSGNFGQYLERVSGNGPLCVRFVRHCTGMKRFIGEFRLKEYELDVNDYQKHTMKTVFETGSRIK